MSDNPSRHARRVSLEVHKLEDRNTPARAVGFAQDHILVAIDQTSSDSTVALNQVSTSAVTTSVEDIGFGVYKVRLVPGVTPDQAASAFRPLPGVRYATRDNFYAPAALPNDPRFGEQWAHKNTGQGSGTPGADIGSEGAWDIGTGTGDTIVAVIDSGVLYTHPDLAANIWRDPTTGEVGYDFGNNDPDPLPDVGLTGADPGAISHGTHVAGIIGAVGDNGIGVAGAAWKTRIMPVKIGSGPQQLGAYSAMIQAIGYAVAHGAKVMNMSYGFDATVLGPAVEGARQADVIFVVAAGNDATDNDLDLAQNRFQQDNAIVVAASDWQDRLSSFSQYGDQSVNIAAPGGDQSRYGGDEPGILSTVAIPTNGYEFFQGTSMAAPQVAGALTAFRDANPDLTYDEVVSALYSTAKRVDSLTGVVGTGAILDFEELMGSGGSSVYATGAGFGGGPHVKVFRGRSSRAVGQFYAYDAAFQGGVRVATGDVNGDDVIDIITVPGPGGGPHVKVFDGKSFTEIASFFAFEPNFTGGLHVTAADVTGDGRADITVGADAGGGPRVSTFALPDGAAGFNRVADFFAYDPGFTGGVRVAAGRSTGVSAAADVFTAPGLGGGPHLKVFRSADLLAGTNLPAAEGFSGDVNDLSGRFIAAGDFNGDGLADVVAAAGSNSSVIRLHDGQGFGLINAANLVPALGELPGLTNPVGVVGTAPITGADLTNGLVGPPVTQVGSTNVTPFADGLIPPAATPTQLLVTTPITKPVEDQGYIFGVRVAAVDVNGDGVAEVIAAAGPSDRPTVTILNGSTLAELRRFFAYDERFFGGVFVGSGSAPDPT